jgi:hypothetical protein
VANHYQALPDDNYCSQGDNAPVHRARVTETLMDESEIIENVWLENEK